LIAWIRFLLGVALIGWAYQADTSWPVLLMLTFSLVRAEGDSYLHQKHAADILACATAIRDIAQWTAKGFQSHLDMVTRASGGQTRH
jgi:hypothetical protein